MSAETSLVGVADPASPRRLSWILFRYITREFLLPLVCCLLAFVVLFLVDDVFDVLGDFLEAKASFRDIVHYFAILQPLNLVNVLPMSILLACSFMVHNLGRHHELTAIRSAGLSLLTCGLPIWLLALLLSGVSFWVSESLAPVSSRRAEEIRVRWTESESRRERKAKLAFNNTGAKRDWFFEFFQREGTQRGVLIKQFREDDAPDWELQAARAEYRDEEWTFYHGVIRHYDLAGRLPEGRDIRFSTYTPVRGVLDGEAEARFRKNIDESPGMILNHLRPVHELSVRRMLRILSLNPSMPQTARDVYVSTVWYRISFPFSCLIGAFLGFSLSLTLERGGALAGFAMAVGLMVLYYVISQLFLVLGKNGYVPPFVAGCLPTLGFISWGVWDLFRKR